MNRPSPIKSDKPDMGELEVLIAELEIYEKSVNFNLAGYSQKDSDGEEYFCCMICGHSPKLLLERLKNIRNSTHTNRELASRIDELRKIPSTPIEHEMLKSLDHIEKRIAQLSEQLKKDRK